MSTECFRQLIGQAEPQNFWLAIAAASALPTVVTGAVGFLVKRLIRGQDTRMDRQDNRLDRHEQRIQEIVEETVSREDWLRESGRIMQKQDRMIVDLAELKGQNQATIIAAAVAAVFKKSEIQP